MEFNAFVLSWTMNEYEKLQEALSEARFVFRQEAETEHIRVTVPFERVGGFGELCQKHLNEFTNYVDIQYPDRKTTVIVFQKTIFFVTNPQENERAKAWAVEMGLPPEQAEWGTSY